MGLSVGLGGVGVWGDGLLDWVDLFVLVEVVEVGMRMGVDGG